MFRIQRRFAFIDAAKGLGILLVFAGHLLPYTSRPSCVIFSFHMPLFFFLSGVFAKGSQTQTLSAYAEQTAKRFLPVFVVFGALGLLVTFIVPGYNSLSTAGVLRDLYTGAPQSINVGQLWFLVSLFEIRIAFWLADRYVLAKSSRVWNGALLVGVFALMAVTPYVVPYFPFKRFPLRLDSSFTGFFFYLCGYYTRNLVLGLQNVKKVRTLFVFVPCLALTVFVSPVNGWVNIASLKHYNWLLYFLFAFSGITAAILLGLYVSKSKILTFLGRNSLTLFAVDSLARCVYVSALRILLKYTSLPIPPIRDGELSMTMAWIGTVVVTGIGAAAAVLYNKGMALLREQRRGAYEQAGDAE